MALYFPVACEHINPPITAVFSQFAVHRSLLTAYPFILQEKSVKVFQYYNRVVPGFKIMDSGIYTLMKDRKQGQSMTSKYLIDYTHRYIHFIKSMNFKFPIVEMDVQHFNPKVLETLRQMFMDAGLAEQTIFVWHLEDGPDKFDWMVRNYKRVAISKADLLRLSSAKAAYESLLRRNGNAEHLTKCHLHLLGSALPSDLIRHGDNVSGDTSSWHSLALFGETRLGGRIVATYRQNKLLAPKDILERVDAAMSEMCRVYAGHPEYRTGTRIRRSYIRVLATSLAIYIDFYERLRRKSTKSLLEVVDPLDYFRLYEEKNRDKESFHAQKQKVSASSVHRRGKDPKVTA